MKFYFYPNNNGKPHRMKMSEVREHLSEPQIEDAKDAKTRDPEEEVCYMAVGGCIVVEL